MADPTTVAEIIARVKEARRRFDETVAPLTDAQMQEPMLPDSWSVKDTLAHMTFWDKRMIHAIQPEDENASRLAPALIADIPYSDQWTNTVNERIYQRNRGRSLAEIKAEFEQTYARLLSVIGSLTEHDAFDPDGLSQVIGLPGFLPAELFGIYGHYEDHAKAIETYFKARGDGVRSNG